MKPNFLLLLFFLLPNLTACGQTSQKNVTNKIEDEWKELNGNNYSIQYPNDWDLDTTGKLGTIFFIYSRQTSPQDQFRENINMAIQNIQGQKIDLDKYVEISEGQIRTIITNGDLIESKRLNANGLEFHKVIFTGEQGIFKLKFEQYYWLKNGNAYILTFSCEQNQFDTYKPVGERILNSFRLK